MPSNCLSAKGRVHWDRSKHTSAKFRFCLRGFLTCATRKNVRQNLIPLATANQWQCSRQETPLSILSMCTFVNSVLCQLCQLDKTALRHTLGLLSAQWLTAALPSWAPDCTDPSCFLFYNVPVAISHLLVLSPWKSSLQCIKQDSDKV